MNSNSLFVWIYLPGHSHPIVAGRLDITKSATAFLGEFTYGKSYLTRPDAIAIDPVALPLQVNSLKFTTLNGFPGAILDSCPDRWGIKVINRLSGEKSFPTGYILMNDPGRSGNLAFSTSHQVAPNELISREFSITELMKAAEDIESDREVDPELLKALNPGTGGARPKCNVVDSEGVWIAKFPSLEDKALISIPRLEYATMTLGDLCGIHTAKTRIENINGKDVCFVKRFDRAIKDGNTSRKGFISARTIFYADPTFNTNGATGSYGRIARWMKRYGCNDSDAIQLFKRMVFNVAVRNSDDHELNHGLVHIKNGIFELSPAYDIAPVIGSNLLHYHALQIGDSAAGTVENLISGSASFGIKQDQAYEIIAEIRNTISANWQDVFYSSGFGDEDIRRVEQYFRNIPVNDSSKRHGAAYT